MSYREPAPKPPEEPLRPVEKLTLRHDTASLVIVLLAGAIVLSLITFVRVSVDCSRREPYFPGKCSRSKTGYGALSNADLWWLDEKEVAFEQDQMALEWHGSKTAWTLPAIIDGALLALIILAIRKRSAVVEIDPELRMLSARGQACRLDDIEDVRVNAIKGGPYRLKVMIDGELREVGDGNRESVHAAADAIRRALGERVAPSDEEGNS